MIGRRVLLVEDDPDLQHFVRTVLSLEGAVVTVAANGTDALALCRDGNEYDLMILDLALPDFSGWEVLRRFDELKPAHRCKVIIFSATADAASVQRAARDGFSYIVKPIDARGLVQTVKRLLRGAVDPAEAVTDAGQRLD